ncbi:hypothetical protein [Mesorhizobium sp. WSM2239]|uniref:Uncharacterized protein n=2 Tax=unclassified Mesorhizobium TaxID=325217 RepID=A0AAU8D0Y4_9HYPH
MSEELPPPPLNDQPTEETPVEEPIEETPVEEGPIVPDVVIVPYTVFDLATGEILRSGLCQSDVVDLQATDPLTQGVLAEASDDIIHYVLAGVKTLRPAFSISKTEIAADDIDEAVIAGLPDPVEVAIDSVTHTIEGGTLTLSSPMPATYMVKINHWPYLPFTAQITAL